VLGRFGNYSGQRSGIADRGHKGDASRGASGDGAHRKMAGGCVTDPAVPAGGKVPALGDLPHKGNRPRHGWFRHELGKRKNPPKQRLRSRARPERNSLCADRVSVKSGSPVGLGRHCINCSFGRWAGSPPEHHCGAAGSLHGGGLCRGAYRP